MGRLGHEKSVSLSHVFQGLKIKDLKPSHLESPSRVAQCHTCDIARGNHKLIWWNGLDLELQSNVTHFYEKRFLL